MKELKCIIVDDEMHSSETTKMFLEMVSPEVEVVDTCASAIEGAKSINSHHPDFVLLDIQMPGMTGIEMLGLIPDFNGEVIFITAYDQYAIDAFKKGVAHYLLKPLDPEDLKLAIDRVALSIKSRKDTSFGNWLSISDHNGWNVLRKGDIIRCEAFKNYTTIYTEDESFTISKTLKEVEQKLSEEMFYRVHSSHLINVTQIHKVIKSDGGNVQMKNGELIPIAKLRKKAFFEWFKSKIEQV